MNEQKLDWKAEWIWGGEKESPRNEWWCFRKNFTLQPQEASGAELSITADSRYILYVNGVRVGQGPSRSWPAQQSYDTYDVSHLLREGEGNVIAVLVQHFGTSTFSYVKGRGGLLVQLNLPEGNKGGRQIVTDGSWKALKHPGQDPKAQRMAMQLAFTERIDARQFDPGWMMCGYDDSSWEQARVIGPVGMSPWTELVPRSIPFLTEEPVFPVRVQSLSRVEPYNWTTTLDTRAQMVPESQNHANAYNFAGFLGTVIRAERAGNAVISFAHTPPTLQAIVINGVRFEKSGMKGIRSEKYLEFSLRTENNLVLFVMAGSEHGRNIIFGIDADVPFTVVSPDQEASYAEGMSPFITIGPFEMFEYIDHRYGAEEKAKQRVIKACGAFESSVEDGDADSVETLDLFRSIGRSARPEELSAYKEWIRPMPEIFAAKESILALAVWKKQEQALPVPRSLQQLAVVNRTPATIPLFDGADTEIILDFGKQGVGHISFEVEAAEGTILDFYGFEHMQDGWIQHTNYLENTFRYTCREGRQTYVSPVRRGLRYLMVTVRGASRPVKMHQVHLLQSHYPAPEVGTFRCSDALLNEAWKMSRHTTRLCMEDTFVDCPMYEQTFWVGDARNEALIAYYLFGAEELVERCLDLVPGSRDLTPLYADQVPTGWSSVIPNWTFFWVIACREYYARTGKEDFLHRIWPDVVYTIDHYLMLLDPQGLLSLDAWNFLDWAPIDQPREGVVSHQNMFLVRALRSAAEIAELTGDRDKQSAYLKAAEDLRSAINRHLWSEERQAYLDCIHADGRPSSIFSMQSQVTALLCRIPDGDRKDMLLGYLGEEPEGFVPIGSPFMAFFYYEALIQAGRPQTMIEDIRTQYAQMIEYDASTCWEMYPKLKDGKTDPHNLTRSHCHAWSAAPGYFLGTTVLGVQGVTPGWSKVTIKPELCGLSWARGSVPLPRDGRIDVAWKLDSEGLMNLKVWLPDTVEAEVQLPDGVRGKVQIHPIGVDADAVMV